MLYREIIAVCSQREREREREKWTKHYLQIAVLQRFVQVNTDLFSWMNMLYCHFNHQTNKCTYLKFHIKTLQHVSILRSSSLLKCWSDFKCFNVKFYVSALVGVIIKVILQNARYNNKVVVLCFGQQLLVKGKAISLRAWTVLRAPGGWGFRFQESRLMKVVKFSALRTGRLYLPGNIPGSHFC